MARTAKDTGAATELGQALEALRVTRRATMAFERVARTLDVEEGCYVSTEQVRKYHRGEVDPNVAPIEHLLALAAFYGVDPGDLHPIVDARYRTLRRRFAYDFTDVAEVDARVDEGPDLGITGSPCNADGSPRVLAGAAA